MLWKVMAIVIGGGVGFAIGDRWGTVQAIVLALVGAALALYAFASWRIKQMRRGYGP